MTNIVISGSGLNIPPYSISNEELVTAYNAHVERYNQENAAQIEAGELQAKKPSSVEFIEKASGIKSRYTFDKEGPLDLDRMCVNYPARADDELSMQAEEGLVAVREALAQANKKPEDVDALICGCSYYQRPYPAISIEMQAELGFEGFAYDMSVACSSATFAIQAAVDAIKAGRADCVVVSCPEIPLAQMNWGNRDCHFIFGDAPAALVVEREDTCQAENALRILDVDLKTKYSSNIRTNFGYMNIAEGSNFMEDDKFFYQQGRKVFKEVCPMVVDTITTNAEKLGLQANKLSRLWLHQANINMINYVIQKIFGKKEVDQSVAPIELHRFGNVSSASAIIAFHTQREGLEKGDKGVICSFGAGYSIGTVFVEQL